MSEYKTRAEMASDDEFVQYLERLKSGSLIADEGINRSLERLAENVDAALSAAMSAQTQHLISTADITWSPNTITFGGGNIAVNFVSPAQSARRNFITNPTNLVLPSATGVAYVVLDRSTDGATVSFQTAASMAAYQTLLESASNRADYFLFAVSDTDLNLRLFSGHVLRPGESIINDGATDTQYGQQTELTLVRENQKDNLKLMLTRGGDISWDAGTGTLTFSENLVIEFPADAGINRVLANSFVIPSGNALYVTLSRNPVGVVTLVPSVASTSGAVPDTDDTFVIAIHNGSDSRIYLWDGTAISDGETVKLGGVRLGVQFYYREPGLGVNSQIYNLTTLVGANTEYRVGSGELMVYRNGRKATPSKAFWQGTYATTGSLNTSQGPLSPLDDYLEEDADGVGGARTGNRIIWLREDPTPLGGSLTANEIAAGSGVGYFPAGTFPANLEQTFPQSDDIVEIFIGNQGAAPFVTIPDGVYGFDLVWTQAPDTVRTRGGTVVINGLKYENDAATPLEVVLDGTATPPTVFPSDGVPDNDWAFIYLGPGATVGGQPDIRISSTPPSSGGGWGVHPSDPDYKFLTSAFVRSGRTAFRAFSKAGSWVHLDQNASQSIVSAFAAAVTGSFENIDLISSGHLPASALGPAKIQLNVTTDVSVSAGDGVAMQLKQTGFSWTSLPLATVKFGNDPTVQFEFETVARDFDVLFPASDFTVVDGGIVLGYAEGRFTSGQGLES